MDEHLLDGLVLQRMAVVLGIENEREVDRLRQRVELALLELKANREVRTPSQLRRALEKLEDRRDPVVAVARSDEDIHRHLEATAADISGVEGRGAIPPVRRFRERDLVREVIRASLQRLPSRRRGRRADEARFEFVLRAWEIYSRAQATEHENGGVSYRRVTRRWDSAIPGGGEPYGRFHEFVVLAHEAADLPGPDRGVDGAIRTVLKWIRETRDRRERADPA